MHKKKSVPTLIFGANVLSTIVVLFLAWFILLDSFYLGKTIATTKLIGVGVAIVFSGFILFDHWRQRKGGVQINPNLILAVSSFLVSSLLITVPEVNSAWIATSLMCFLLTFVAVYSESAEQCKTIKC